MRDDLEIFKFDPKDTVAKHRLAEFVDVVVEAERWQAVRAGVAEWLVWLAIPVWVVAVRPHLLPHGVDRLVLALWALTLAFFLYAMVTERKLQRRREHYAIEQRSAEE